MRSIIITSILLMVISTSLWSEGFTPAPMDLIYRQVIEDLAIIKSHEGKSFNECVPFRFNLVPITDFDGNVVEYFAIYALPWEELHTMKDLIVILDEWSSKKELREIIETVRESLEFEEKYPGIYRPKPPYPDECLELMRKLKDDNYKGLKDIFPRIRTNVIPAVMEISKKGSGTISFPDIPSVAIFYLYARISAERYFGTKDIEFDGFAFQVKGTKELPGDANFYRFRHADQVVYVAWTSQMFPNCFTEEKLREWSISEKWWIDKWGDTAKKTWETLINRWGDISFKVKYVGENIYEICEIDRKEQGLREPEKTFPTNIIGQGFEHYLKVPDCGQTFPGTCWAAGVAIGKGQGRFE